MTLVAPFTPWSLEGLPCSRSRGPTLMSQDDM